MVFKTILAQVHMIRASSSSTSMALFLPRLCSLLYFSILILPMVDSVYFRKSEFRRGDTDIQYQGDAKPDGFIEFNNVDYVSRVGWATYAERVPLWNPSSGELSDFSTNFSFRIDTRFRETFGHGLSFFLAPVGAQIPPNSAAGFMGLFNETNSQSSPYPLVSVEFDSWQNDIWDPPEVKSHVGINNNSLFSLAYTSWNTSFHSQDIADARIIYDAQTQNLSVSWKYRTTHDPRENASLYHLIDLSRALPSWVTIGFSAATGSGAYIEGHRLLSWEFRSSLEIDEKDSKRKKVGIIVGSSVAAVVLVFSIIVAFILLLRRQRKRKASEAKYLRSINEDLERGAGPRRFSYRDLASATNNFSGERKLGEGGFGAVYKGYLSDSDTMVAVKKISSGSRQGKKEYVTEIKIISSLRHRNLVQLIGWCHEKGDFLLVYEFMPNSSLDSHLFGQRSHLAWAIRYKISQGLGSALLYLHEEWEQCVVHRDIKPSNIMLDANFNVKLGDFGLARLMDHELGVRTTGLAGTLGYMAPEYVSTGRASKESDVYSFGVVLLEIVTGRKSVDPAKPGHEVGLVEWVWDMYGKGDLLSRVDGGLGANFDGRQAECVMAVGLWCAHPDPSSRPSIRQAIQVLNFENPLPNLPGKMPVPTYHVVSTSSASSGDPSITFSNTQIGR